ncbi:hypothetical protein [Streptomyces typhae]|nr:hypothetical protein [Streptomyces typhae]
MSLPTELPRPRLRPLRYRYLVKERGNLLGRHDQPVDSAPHFRWRA